MEFLKVDSVQAAREKLLGSTGAWLGAREHVPLQLAPGRILAEDVFAGEDVPAFRRSTVDGYAVCSADTAAAGEGVPAFLSVAGQVEMGCAAHFSIAGGQCAEVATGGMLPGGADAVLMVEYTEPFGEGGIAVYGSVSNGENVVQIGDDAQANSLLLRRGKRILPKDIGALVAVGVTQLSVYRKPRLSIISTGDELIEPGRAPLPGQVRDINTGALTALAQGNGLEVASTAVLPDDEHALEAAIREAIRHSDIVAVSGGSSQGKKDMTRALFDKVAAPGVFTHGLAVKPGKPTILGCDDATRTVLVGLPGHPVAALMMFELLVVWLLREVTGCPPPPGIPARLTCNVAGAPGKLSCWPVQLTWDGECYTARPIFGKSGLITTLASADGYFTSERDTEGLSAWQTVLVHLF